MCGRTTSAVLLALSWAAAIGCGSPVADEMDAQIEHDAGAEIDAPRMHTIPACSGHGFAGSACRADRSCEPESTCVEEALEPETVRSRFGVGQAVPVDPADPRVFVAVSAPVAADDVPVVFAQGSMCTRPCDATVASTCGTCATCSRAIGVDVLGVGVVPFLEDEALRPFGEDTGICRPHCNFDRASRGDCREGHTCDAATNVCLEACRSDAQCRARLVTTEDGAQATWIDTGSRRTCNAITGRCEWTSPSPEPRVGDACARHEDCVADLGVCMPGGTCAEMQCNRTDLAPDTTMDGVCDGGNGVCVAAGGNMGALCVAGCTTAADCNPGNDCEPLIGFDGEPQTIGPFTGYCRAPAPMP